MASEECSDSVSKWCVIRCDMGQVGWEIVIYAGVKGQISEILRRTLVIFSGQVWKPVTGRGY